MVSIDVEADTPRHRHMVVFSYRALTRFLWLAGFENVRAQGFGHYPAPQIAQKALRALDPGRCHQIVAAARKPARA